VEFKDYDARREGSVTGIGEEAMRQQERKDAKKWTSQEKAFQI
jgi:hypothetical protein